MTWRVDSGSTARGYSAAHTNTKNPPICCVLWQVHVACMHGMAFMVDVRVRAMQCPARHRATAGGRCAEVGSCCGMHATMAALLHGWAHHESAARASRASGWELERKLTGHMYLLRWRREDACVQGEADNKPREPATLSTLSTSMNPTSACVELAAHTQQRV